MEFINYESNYNSLVPKPGLNGAEHEGTAGYNHVINESHPQSLCACSQKLNYHPCSA